MQQVPGLSRG